MTVARKFHVEGPIGKQLGKKEYLKMLQQVDAAMQKVLTRKKSRIVKRNKEKV
jgi:hypothetical protein